jgi:hypothetical protein
VTEYAEEASPVSALEEELLVPDMLGPDNGGAECDDIKPSVPLVALIA